MPKIKCIGCGKSKIIPSENIDLQTVLDNGFNFVWNVSDGLVEEILCKDCAEKVRERVHEIEDIIGIEIGLLYLGGYSKYKLEKLK